MKNGLPNNFLGIAQEDIQAGDIVVITLSRDGTFFIGRAAPSSGVFYINDAGNDITKVHLYNDKTEKKELIDRCKRMVVVKKEFSNEEDKL